MKARTSNLTEKGRNRRDQIIRKAIREFSQRGYHETTVTDILHGLPASRGTFYQYFANKRAIFDVIIGDLIKRISEDLRPLDFSDPSRTIREQICTSIALIFDTFLSDKLMTRMLLSGGNFVDREFNEKVEAFQTHLLDLIESTVTLGIELEILHPADPRLVAMCVLGSSKEVLIRAAGNDSEGFDSARTVGQIIYFIAASLFKEKAFARAFGGQGDMKQE